MDKKFVRTAALLGEESMQKLKNSRVAIFGVGGVGSYVLEALVRSGVGSIDVFDNDTVAESNINRQIIATSENIGVAKTDAATLRAKQINPDINIKGFNLFYLPDTADSVDLSQYNYVVDAVDTVAAKLELAERADRLGIPLISIMGTGNKLDPTALRVDDIYKTEGCPLARVMRTELRKRNIKKLKVVWSAETPIKPNELAEKKADGRVSPGSTAFVPATAGLIAASEVVKDIVK